MRSMTFTHGRLGCLWLEVDRHGRVIVQSSGGLSAVARDGMIEDALADLAQQTRLPVSTLRACMVGRSTPWPRRLLAGIMGILFTKGRRND